MKHTEEYKKMMSGRKKKWWEDIRKHKKQYKSMLKNMSKASTGRNKGLNGEKSFGWKGGRFVQKRDGYVYLYVPDHPNARKNSKGGGGHVLEHRLVMEKILGRYLLPDEDVNHINGNKGDNRPENLVVVRHYAHFQEMKCPKCQFTFRTR